MFFEKQKIIQQTNAFYFQKFLSGIKLPLASENVVFKNLIKTVHTYLEYPKQLKLPFQPILKQFNHSNKIQKTKTRLCGYILKKGDRAYKCLECNTQQNSIICLDCFEEVKHKGHSYQLINVFGGCCDCGDAQKWKSQGFCERHKQSQEEIQIHLDNALLRTFIEEQQFAFKIFLYLYMDYLKYSQYLETIKLQGQLFDKEDNKKFRDSTKSKIITFIQKYSILYFKQLVQFNECGIYANTMTEQLLLTDIILQKQPHQITQTNFFKLLFTFTESNKTPEKICDLCITLFQLKNFRKKLTIEYVYRYINDNRFSTSSYSHLSSQLFTSYLAISQLVKQKIIPPLEIFPFLASEADLYDAAQAYVRYYYDISYLSKLYGEVSIEYFRYHAEQNKIIELGGYRRRFNKFAQSNNYYGIEQIFISKILNVVKVMQRDQSSFIFKASLRQLYSFISSSQNNSKNCIRPQQRAFALITMAYFKGDLKCLDDKQRMIEYLAIIGANDLERQIKNIINSICTIFSFAARILDNQKHITQKYTFYSFYFKKNHTLFNLDSILLKIIIKICQFHNNHHFLKINYSEIIKNGDQFFNIINKMQNYENISFENQITTIEEHIQLTPEYSRYFINYLSLLNEAIVSDLPILAISCFLQPTKEEIKKYKLPKISYKAQAIHYYQNILKSCDNPRIAVKQFKTLCDSFFKQEEIFQQFVRMHTLSTDNLRLDSDKSKGFKLNMIHLKSINLRVQGLEPNASIGNLPYFQPTTTIDFIQKEIIELAKKQMHFLSNLENKLEQQGAQNYKAIIYNNYINLFNFVWIIYKQTSNQQIYHFIVNSLSKKQIQGYLLPLSAEISQYDRIRCKIQQNTGYLKMEQASKQVNNQQRLLNKKNALRQQMKKNKQKFITSQKIQQTNEIQECCICRQSKQNQACYISMITENNYNNWCNIDPDNQIYSFKSCGHLVHRSCYTKNLKKNQLYSVCPLCKKPTNIIIPCCIKDQQAQYQFWQDFHKIILTNQLGTRQEESSRIFVSLAAFTAIRGLLFPQLFRKQVKLYRVLASLLLNYIEDHSNQKRKLLGIKLRPSQDQTIQNIFTYIQKSIYQRLFNIQPSCQASQLTNEFKQYVNALIATLFSTNSTHQLMQQELQEIKVMQKSMIRPTFDSNLRQLSSNHTGKCPNCSLVTNHQAICLICPNFITCFNCSKVKMMQHTKMVHKNASSFISASSGEVFYIFRNRIWPFDSIYEDYMGRPFSIGNPKQSYILNMRKLSEFEDDVTNNNIESRLRYKQKQSNKVIHDRII